MNRFARIFQVSVFGLSLATAWLVAATQTLAADPPAPAPADNGSGDYVLSYLVVILGIVLGLLVVAKSSARRDRDRPAGYVEKDFTKD
jgi:hypothetical protein